MNITHMGAQIRNPDRVNISIDGTYRFSLTVAQVVDLGLKIGVEVDEAFLEQLTAESAYGKLYQRALEYCLVRPRSSREVREYLYKKTLATPVRKQKTGEVYLREGVSAAVTNRVYSALYERGYIDDIKFADFWVRHRSMRKGVSERKLRAELIAKGIKTEVIDASLRSSERNDDEELMKIIKKRRARYTDDVKFMQYLARQGFRYDAIKQALERND